MAALQDEVLKALNIPAESRFSQREAVISHLRERST
jgi:hypothetical protein